jgi:hypothetical protein
MRVPSGSRPTNDPPGARRADALGRIAESFLQHSSEYLNGGDRQQIVVHVDVETLREGSAGRCELEEGPSLSAETARRLACDASIVTRPRRANRSASAKTALSYRCSRLWHPVAFARLSLINGSSKVTPHRQSLRLAPWRSRYRSLFLHSIRVSSGLPAVGASRQGAANCGRQMPRPVIDQLQCLHMSPGHGCTRLCALVLGLRGDRIHGA